MAAAATVSFAGTPPLNSRRNSTAAAVRNSVHASPVRNMRRASSLYEMLKVKQTASIGEIKSAYRTLAKMYHPDAAGSSATADDGGNDFIAIHEAYSTLSDPESRAMYDLSLGRGRRAMRVGIRMGPTRNWETDQCW